MVSYPLVTLRAFTSANISPMFREKSPLFAAPLIESLMMSSVERRFPALSRTLTPNF
jgi:hypothetical protein